MRLMEFIFEKGNIISIYGASGTGKTNIGLELCQEIQPSLFISTEGKSYSSRVEKLRLKKDILFIESSNVFELLYALSKTTDLHVKLIVVDTVNKFYKLYRNKKDIELPLILLKSIADAGVKVVMLWQMSGNNRVSGEKFMRNFSDDIMRLSKGIIIGYSRYCKFKINDNGVIGCL